MNRRGFLTNSSLAAAGLLVGRPVRGLAQTPVAARRADVQALADKMSASCVAFARTGNPSNGRIPEWPAYTPDQRATMVWNTDVRVVNDPYREEKDVVAAVRDRA